MRFFRRLILVLLIGAGPVACYPTLTGQPRWVNEPRLDFPADRFLVGVASGETCDDAVDLAIARLSQQIEVEVFSMETHRRLASEVASISETNSFIYDAEVSLVSNTMLLGVEIVETLPLPSGLCVARAVLDIDRSLGLYDEAIAQRTASIESSLSQADQAETIWREFLAVSSALRSAIDHDKLALARRVIASRTRQSQPALQRRTTAIVERYEALRDQISIAVVPVGDCPGVLLQRGESALRAHDLPIEQDHPGSLQLRIGWMIETKQTFDPRWWSCRWWIGVTLYDAERHETIASNQPYGSTAYGMSKEAAEEEARLNAVEQITQAVEIVLRRPGAFSPW